VYRRLVEKKFRWALPCRQVVRDRERAEQDYVGGVRKERREVRGAWRILCAAGLVVVVLSGSGCSVQSLKESNRRLKESNDRLISENNKLEEEVLALQRKLAQPMPEPPPQLAMRSADPGKAPRPEGLDKELLLDDDVEVAKTSQGLRFRIPDRVFFALGQATLSKRGEQILGKVAAIINRDFPGHMVRVDGHTDDTPIRKVKHIYPSNWELSSARACTVVRYLVQKENVNAQRLFPAGFSHYRPVATGSSPTAKGKNRRVEITILNESV